jgi:thiol-disulfide isomerase/thioredoxin
MSPPKLASIVRGFPLLLGLSVFLPVSASAGSESVDWLSAYQSGMSLARQGKLPVLIDFWARWCEPCARMEAEVWRDPRIVKASKGFVMIRLDLDMQEATAQRLGVTAIPTVLFMDPWEKELGRYRGFTALAAVLGSMQRMPSSFESVAASMETLQSNSKAARALVAAGDFYAGAGLAGPAVEFYERALKIREVRTDGPYRDTVRISLGRLVLSAGDAKRARKVFEDALKDCSPENRRTLLLGRARACERLDEGAEARKTYQRILEESPGTEEADQAAAALQKSGHGAGMAQSPLVTSRPRMKEAVPAPSQLPLVELELPRVPRTDREIYTEAVPIVDLTPDAISLRFPDETRRLRPARDQEQLPAILQGVGANVETFFREFPNVSSREHVRQIVSDSSYSRRNDYQHNYLFLVEHGVEGIRWSEDRVDSRGQPISREKELETARRAVFLTSGYAGLSVFFHPRHQASSRFRLLGTDSTGSGLVIVAFAQKPDVDDPTVTGSFSMDGAQCLLMLQGLAWIDPDSFQIVRMHTELLAPRPDVGLHMQTTEVLFEPVTFAGIDRPFWLPREVDVVLDWRRLECRNRHRHSEYRLFTVSSIDGAKKVRVP